MRICRSTRVTRCSTVVGRPDQVGRGPPRALEDGVGSRCMDEGVRAPLNAIHRCPPARSRRAHHQRIACTHHAAIILNVWDAQSVLTLFTPDSSEFARRSGLRRWSPSSWRTTTPPREGPGSAAPQTARRRWSQEQPRWPAAAAWHQRGLSCCLCVRDWSRFAAVPSRPVHGRSRTAGTQSWDLVMSTSVRY